MMNHAPNPIRTMEQQPNIISCTLLVQKRLDLKEEEEKETGGLTAEKIRGLLEGEERLICISIADPFTIKDLVITLSRDLLNRRKRKFQVKPYILFVFDEAQEFIPYLIFASSLLHAH